MRILFLTQYFPPEIGATQTRAFEMARGLVRAGHQVTVVTEVPNHPEGIIHPDYRRRLVYHEDFEGIEVYRLRVSASPRKTFRTRMGFYLSFMLHATLAGLLYARGRFDLLYATSPPLFVGGSALVISSLRRLPLVFEVRDLWPELAVQMGELTNPLAVRLASWLERACYRRAARIIVVTPGTQDHLIERGYPSSKLWLVPNGANTELYTPQPINVELRRELGIEPDQFVVIFTGLHGLAHGLETVLESASILRNHRDIDFLLVGSGPRKEALMQRAEQLALPNVQFHAPVPDSELPGYIALADVGLDTRRKLSSSALTLPVKVFSYMACARPVLLSTEGEAVELLREADAGIAVPPESPQALAEAILRMQADPFGRLRFGRNGRAFVEARFSRQKLAAKLEQLFRGLVFGDPERAL
jgi:colanic acid biosynthesis glycosyl transferase WcaI